MFRPARYLSAVLMLCIALTAPAHADYAAGLKAYDAGDYKTAMEEWLPLAEAGDAKAQHKVGRLFGLGEGVVIDKVEAFRWYAKAAEQGYVLAIYNIGLYHENGWGTSKNVSLAIEWYQRAAELNDTEAILKLGVIYDLGQGVPKDHKLGAKFFMKGAKLCDHRAQTNLAVLFLNGDGVPLDDYKARFWFDVSEMNGSTSSMPVDFLLYANLGPRLRERAKREAKAWNKEHC